MMRNQSPMQSRPVFMERSSRRCRLHGERGSIQNGSWPIQHAVRQTRPHIANAVSAVSSCQQHPTKRHWIALKKVYRYLAGTPDRGLLFHGGCEPVSGAWCDADCGTDAVDSKSRTGYIITIGGTAVDWLGTRRSRILSPSALRRPST